MSKKFLIILTILIITIEGGSILFLFVKNKHLSNRCHSEPTTIQQSSRDNNDHAIPSTTSTPPSKQKDVTINNLSVKLTNTQTFFWIKDYTITMDPLPQDWIVNIQPNPYENNQEAEITLSKEYCKNGICKTYDLIIFSPTPITIRNYIAQENNIPFITINNRNYKTTAYSTDLNWNGYYSSGNCPVQLYSITLEKDLHLGLQSQYCVSYGDRPKDRYKIITPQADLDKAKELIESISWKRK